MKANDNYLISHKMEQTAAALQKNHFPVHMAKDRHEAYDIIKSLLHKGDSVSHGGSVTLEQIKIKNLLANGDYLYLDRDNKDSDTETFYQKALSCDVYLTSSNAVTEDGQLYNVDGYGNRVAVYSFGPKKVIVAVGWNKIVPTLSDAVKRVKTVAAPQNCLRLNKQTPCAKTGHCIALKGKMSDGCQSPDRICRHYVTTANQREDLKRIEVILIQEELGY